MNSGELLRLIEVLHREKDIDKEVLFETIEAALLTVAKRKKDLAGAECLSVKIDRDTGFAARFYHAIAIFLADRLRATVSLFGYGDIDYGSQGAREEDELDELIMDNVSLAGDRFHRMLTRMIEGG